MINDLHKQRYSRNIMVKGIGEEGQEKLFNAKVLVVGAGGIGSPVLLYLAAAGIGTIGIVDCDTVDVSNLQRQIIHSEEKIGTSKASSARDEILRLNSEVKVVLYDEFFEDSNAKNIVQGYDIVVDATDNMKAKFLINDVCTISKIPFVHTGAVGMQGQIMSWIPGRYSCLRCLFGDKINMEYAKASADMGIVGTTAGLIGTIAASEVIKYFTGIGEMLSGYMLQYDGEKQEFSRTKLPPASSNCNYCRKKS